MIKVGWVLNLRGVKTVPGPVVPIVIGQLSVRTSKEIEINLYNYSLTILDMNHQVWLFDSIVNNCFVIF